MRAVVGVPLIALLAIPVGCGRSTFFATGDAGPKKGSSGTSSGGATGGGASSGGGSGTGSTGGNGSGGSSTGGGTTTGTSSSGSGGGTSGGTTGSSSCGFNLVWDGDHCIAVDCARAAEGTPCLLGGGNFGACYGGTCQDLSLRDDQSCGGLGLICPAGSSCTGCDRPFPCCLGSSCAQSTCPSGSICVDGAPGKIVCVTAACAPSLDGHGCLLSADAGTLGNCCGTSCVSLDGNPDHCGGCGVTCPAGMFCDHKVCAPAVDCTSMSRVDCPLPGGGTGMCCLGACADVSNDPLNCGSCGTTCALGFTCTINSYGQFCYPGRLDGGAVAQNCDVPGGGCPPGRSCDPRDPYHCIISTCTAEAQGWNCSDGTFNFTECCDSICTALNLDPSNCGACGHRCAAGQGCLYDQCVDSSCSGDPDDTGCVLADGGAGNCCNQACVDLSSDSQHCGSCGLGCPLTANCALQPGYPPSLAYCTTDAGRLDCSVLGCGLGYGCANNQCLTTTCGVETSLCALADPMSAGFELGVCCGGACVSPTGADSCGCGLTCPSGTSCCAIGSGQCCLPGTGTSFPCSPDSNGPWPCPAGSRCVGRQCAAIGCAGREEGAACASGATQGICCGGACADPTQDPRNCNGCGLGCDGGICFERQCLGAGPALDCSVSCAPGFACFFGECIGSLCTGGTYCLARSGQLGVCCGDGSCSDLATDPQDCGLCQSTCPAGQTCQAGSCSGAGPPCGVGHLGLFCDLDAGTKLCCAGGCADTAVDPTNCGACGTICPAGSSCVAGTCT